jgi:hypothetical protein
MSGFLWGWLLFVGLPALSVFYGFSILLDDLREHERQEFHRSAADLGNQIFSEADEISFVRNRFQLRKANLGSPLTSNPSNQFEILVHSDEPQGIHPNLEKLAICLGDQQEPGPEIRKHWEKELGFFFSLELAKQSQDKPFPIKWLGKSAHLIWSQEKVQDQRPRTHLFICRPPPSVTLLARAFSRNSHGYSGGIADLGGGRTYFSPHLKATTIQNLIKKCRFYQQKTLSEGDDWFFWERCPDGMALFLHRPQTWGIPRQNLWQGVFALFLPIFGTWLFFRVQESWERLSIRGKIIGIVLVFTAFPLLFGSIFLVKVNGRLQPAATEDWLQTARHELRLFDQQFLEQIQNLESRFIKLTSFPCLHQSFNRVKEVFLDQFDRDWLDSFRLYSVQGDILAEKMKFGSDEGFAELESFFAERQIEKAYPRAGLSPVTANDLFMESVVDESRLGLFLDKVNAYKFGENLIYGFFTLLDTLPASNVVYAVLSITHEALTRKFFHRQILRHRTVRVLIRDHQSGVIFPRVKASASLLHFFQGIQRARGERIGRVRLGKTEFAAIGFPGKNLQGYDLVALTQQSSLESKTNRLRRDAAFLLLLTAGVSICAALHLFGFFLMPIRRVSEGLEAVGRGNFAVSIPVSGQHELGLMAMTFNHFIETLRELNQAKTVQSTLIPTEMPEYNGYEIASHCTMCGSIGGDYLDVFPLSDGRMVCLIGDVSGHGTSSAMIMAIAKTRVFLHFDAGHPPSELFSRLHESIRNLALKSQMMTMVVVLLDNRTHQIEVWNAGHPYPILSSPGHGQTGYLGQPAYPLGTRKQIVIPPQKSPIGPEDVLVLYSDGLVEAVNPQQTPLSFEALADFVGSSPATSAQDLLDRILQKWHLHLGGVPPTDDLSILVIRRKKHHVSA